MIIGVVSDTHGKFDPALEKLFNGVELIIHAGDIGRLDIIDDLARFAPVIAVEGNNDSFGRYPEEQVSEIAGRRILVTHIFGELQQITKREHATIERVEPDIVVFGHSHRPYADLLGQTVLFNPGSAGPRRFSLPRTAALLSLNKDTIDWKIVDLDTGKVNQGEFEDRPKTGREASRQALRQAQ